MNQSRFCGSGLIWPIGVTRVLRLGLVLSSWWLTGSHAARAGANFFTASHGLDSQYYQRLDMERAARDQWGAMASAVCTGYHLYDWRARVGHEIKSLDLNRAVARQYGPGWTIAATGIGRFDWVAVNFGSLHHTILPIMMIAADKFHNLDEVGKALDQYQAALIYAQNWYACKAGQNLQILRPLILSTDHSAAEWNTLAATTARSQYRFDLFYTLVGIYEQDLPLTEPSNRVIIMPFTGDQANLWLGAAEGTDRYGRGVFAVTPVGAGNSRSLLPLACWVTTILLPLLENGV